MSRRLLLLAGQTLLLGVVVAFLVVPASALFLHAYGAAAVPYAYVTVAFAGIAVSTALTRAQRRWSLGVLGVWVLAAHLLLVLGAWLVLATSGARWVTFPLLVLFPLAIPTGFLVVGAQAIRLFDVRELKSAFPRIAAGFSIGFALGGAAAAGLVRPLGGPIPLLLVGAVATVVMMALVWRTARAFPALLLARPEPSRAAIRSVAPGESRGRRRGRRGGDLRVGRRLRLGELWSDPLVGLVLGYQVLSSATTQLCDFMVWERAAAYYADPDRLAEFLGIFGAVLNVTSLLFVFLVAGPLMTRFGVGGGLLANPLIVVVVLTATLAIGVVGGAGGLAFLLAVCAAQISDISATDGLTRASIATTYQALPPARRLRAQTLVEGAGIPVAVGLVGLLLIAQGALGIEVRVVAAVTLAVTLGWAVVAVRAHRQYGRSLATLIATREWDPELLRLDDPAARVAVRNLLASPSARDRVTALEALADGRSPDLPAEAARAVSDVDPAVREAGLAAAVRSGLGRDDALRVAWPVLTGDPDIRLRVLAAAALVGSPGEPGQQALEVWREAARGVDERATTAAVEGAATRTDPAFVPELTRLARLPVPPPGIGDALARQAPLLVDDLPDLLGGHGDDEAGDLFWARVVEALGRSGDVRVHEALVARLGTAQRDEARHLADALGAGPLADRRHSGVRPEVLAALIAREAERVRTALGVTVALEESPLPDLRADRLGRELLRGALADDVAECQRIVARVVTLGPAAGTPGALERALASVDPAVRHTAEEVLDESVGRRPAATALAVLDPALTLRERRDALAALSPAADPGQAAPERTAGEWLRDLVLDPDGFWCDGWLGATALRAAPGVDLALAHDLAFARLGDRDPVVAETAAWVLRTTPAPVRS